MSKKYRPYLSLPMMERISELANKAKLILPLEIDNEIIDCMSIMILKARHEITKPSYVPLSNRLGMSVPVNEQTGLSYRYNAGLMSPEEKEEYEQSLQAEIMKGLTKS